MAILDVSAIEGYESMSAEDKVRALEAFDFNDNSAELERYKNAVSKANAEAKQWKDKFNAKTEEAKSLMSEEQQKQAALTEAAEADKAEKEELKARIAELEKNNTLREYTMSFSGLGLDEKAAADTAKAMADGNSVKVFENLKKFLESYKKSIEAELMSKTPRPDGAGHGEDGKESAAITKAKQLFGAQSGTNQNYASVMGNYIKK